MKKGKLLTITLIIIILIIIIAIGYFIYNIQAFRNKSNEKLSELENTVLSLKNTIDEAEKSNNTNTTITNPDNTTSIEKSNILGDMSYIEIELETIGNEGPIYKALKITDKNVISNLKNIINNAQTYTSENIGGFFEGCPILKVYQTDGKELSIIASDNFFEDNKTTNIIGVSTKKDFSDKVLYQVETQLAQYLEKIYNQYN